jgi:hypothetical protein
MADALGGNLSSREIERILQRVELLFRRSLQIAREQEASLREAPHAERIGRTILENSR